MNRSIELSAILYEPLRGTLSRDEDADELFDGTVRPVHVNHELVGLNLTNFIFRTG